MALMLEDMRAAAERSQPQSEATPAAPDKASPPESPEPDPEGHGHSEHAGLLGGHLGLDGAEHVAHEVLAAKTDATHGVLSGKTDAAHGVLSAKSDALSAKTDAAHEVMAAKSDAAHVATNTALVATSAVLGAASCGLGGYMLYTGVKDLKAGLHARDAEATIEGANGLLVGTRSLAAAATMAGHVFHGSEVIATIASTAKSVLTPLGLIHGAVDAGLGVKNLVVGVQEHNRSKQVKGGLGIGLGLSLMATAVGGGIPALICAGAFLGGKVYHALHEAS